MSTPLKTYLLIIFIYSFILLWLCYPAKFKATNPRMYDRVTVERTGRGETGVEMLQYATGFENMQKRDVAGNWSSQLDEYSCRFHPCS